MRIKAQLTRIATVGQLRALISGLPDDMQLWEDTPISDGIEEGTLWYLAIIKPAEFEGRDPGHKAIPITKDGLSIDTIMALPEECDLRIGLVVLT